MARKLAPTKQCLNDHIAVRFKDFILVFSQTLSVHTEHFSGGRVSTYSTNYITWIYNLWTEQWKKNIISNQEGHPISGQTGVVIGTDVYIFGGHEHKSMLWTLIRNANGSFVLHISHAEDQSKVPSPRTYHCAWEYSEKMWVFGGDGPSIDYYLNDHGTFYPRLGQADGSNNQLFFYNPSIRIWINIKCLGEVPSPRYKASTASIQDNVWLYGGTTENNWYCNDFYELNMHSFTWTKIETLTPRPQGRNRASLTQISASQLVLYGGFQENMCDPDLINPWIFNIQSHTWKQHPEAEANHRWGHTGTTVLNSAVIILGGCALSYWGSQHHARNTSVYLMLEPKSLQQLAIRMIYKHKSKLPLENLPSSLTCKIVDAE